MLVGLILAALQGCAATHAAPHKLASLCFFRLIGALLLARMLFLPRSATLQLKMLEHPCTKPRSLPIHRAKIHNHDHAYWYISRHVRAQSQDSYPHPRTFAHFQACPRTEPRVIPTSAHVHAWNQNSYPTHAPPCASMHGGQDIVPRPCASMHINAQSQDSFHAHARPCTEPRLNGLSIIAEACHPTIQTTHHPLILESMHGDQGQS
eukprot:1160088-Pelagomonas_calceolata.AAC.9